MILKFKLSFSHTVICPKVANGMAKSVDTDPIVQEQSGLGLHILIIPVFLNRYLEIEQRHEKTYFCHMRTRVWSAAMLFSA